MSNDNDLDGIEDDSIEDLELDAELTDNVKGGVGTATPPKPAPRTTALSPKTKG